MFKFSGIPEPTEFNKLITHLRKVGTDLQFVEVKTAAGGLPKKMGQTVSAFANGRGGLIVLGLNEENGFIPAPNFVAKNVADVLENLCATRMTPAVYADIELIQFEDQTIVVAWIPEMKVSKPCFIKEEGMLAGSYLRVGDGNRNLTVYEVNRLAENFKQPAWDSAVVAEASVKDFDLQLVSGLVNRLRRDKLRSMGDKTDETILRMMNAIKPDTDGIDRPTLLGLISLGTYPQQYFPRLNITFTAYPGIDKRPLEDGTRFLDNKSFDGPIPYLIQETIAAVQRNSATTSVVTGSFRQDIPDYPVVALREALANALMHRDYSDESRGSQVMVEMYVDRIEISNPGGLYGPVTVDSLEKDGVSASRNAALSKLLESLPYDDKGAVAENRGTGYLTILTELERMTMPKPTVQNTFASFKITFYKRKLPQIADLPAVSDTGRVILEFLHKYSSATTMELAEAAGVTPMTVRRVLQKLLKSNEVERMEPARSPKQRYRLPKNSL